jgi:hypothetical protein
MHFERTEVVNGYQKGVKEEKWYFGIEGGELTLNHKNFSQCADFLFEGIPDSFSEAVQ